MPPPYPASPAAPQEALRAAVEQERAAAEERGKAAALLQVGGRAGGLQCTVHCKPYSAPCT